MPEHVLIIDDEPRLVAVLQIRLQASGFRVDVAYNGEEGLAKAARLRPQVVLLDVNMPVMDGLQVCRSLRADPELSGTRVIVMSAVTHETARDNAIMAGADLFVAKPYQAPQVISAIRSVMESQGSAGGKSTM
jgi:DNA-binding response OmpR family regulator